MNKAIRFITVIIGVCALFLTSCKKEVRKGCTDPNSLNYNVLAEEDDGSCEYLDSTVTILSNGTIGYWGSPSTGGFSVESCYTGISTIFLNPDTTITPADTVITPADTIINNAVSPPDTTIIPADTTITAADTTITGNTYLLVNSNVDGNYELIIKCLNKKNGLDFKNGYLIFTAMLHQESTISSFDVIINGNHINYGASFCNDFRQSDPVGVPTSILNTTSFSEVTIPLLNFSNRYMKDVDLVFGIKGSNAGSNKSIIIIKDIKWVSNLD
ncbi:MAG: hypothetical protein AB7O47_04250 [Flavobacteriales bacterium]